MTIRLSRRSLARDPAAEARRRADLAQAAEYRAALVRAELERTRAQAELRRELDSAAHIARQNRNNRRRADRAYRRTARLARWHALVASLRPVVPLLLVNALAVTGQVGYGLDNLTAPGTARVVAVAMAGLFAAALESIALYVGWHAHAALLAGASGQAARLRLASYAVAAVVAGINYAHYATPDGSPTAAAVAFGLVSLLSPWLWGLHSRRALHAQLELAGLVDSPGARFSAQRWRAFPLRTWAARRWSIDYGIADPQAAWFGYNAARRERERSSSRPAERDVEQVPHPPALDRDGTEVPAGTVRPIRPGSNEDGELAGRMREAVLAAWDQGRAVSGSKLDREFGTRDYGRRIIRQLRDEFPDKMVRP